MHVVGILHCGLGEPIRTSRRTADRRSIAKPSWRLLRRCTSDKAVAVESDDVNHWFGEYLDAFAACGRGESETASLLEYYRVPLLITTGDGFYARP